MLESDAVSSMLMLAEPAVEVRETKPVKPSAAATPALDDEHHRMIAEAAYYRAEHRGFAAGAELDDWLQAEQALMPRQEIAAAA